MGQEDGSGCALRAPSSVLGSISTSTGSGLGRDDANGDNGAAQGGFPHDTEAFQPARKRKRRFKYLLENQAQGRGDDKNGEGDDGDRDGSGQDADGKKESRKKVKKACIFCKRSHMPCEEARPCRRCVKRGIPTLCRDAEPQGSNGKQTIAASSKAKAGSSKGKGKEDTSPDSPYSASPEPDQLDIPGVSERDPDFQPAMSISLLLHPANVSTTRMSQAPVYAAYADGPASGSRSGSGSGSRPGLGQGHGPSTTDMDAPPPTKARSEEATRNGQLNRSVPAAYTEDYAEVQGRAWGQNMDLTSQRELMRLLEAGPSAVDLNDAFGDKPTSLLNYPNMFGLPVSEALSLQGAGNSPSPAPGHGSNGNSDGYEERSRDSSYHVGSNSSLAQARPNEMHARPKHILQEEHATTAELLGIRSYSYTYGYAKLARWMQTRFSRESCEAVDRCLGQIRPKFLAISRSLSERELLAVEEAFISLVHHYQANVLEFVPLPTFVTRRTGEIYAANEHAARFLGLPKSLLEGGQISHFQTAPEEEVVKLWELYANECMGLLKDAPLRVSKIEIDRSLLLFNKPGFDPHTGELLGDGSGLCEDGSPAVIRKKCMISFEAKISQHGLPVMLVAQYSGVPDDLEEQARK